MAGHRVVARGARSGSTFPCGSWFCRRRLPVMRVAPLELTERALFLAQLFEPLCISRTAQMPMFVGKKDGRLGQGHDAAVTARNDRFQPLWDALLARAGAQGARAHNDEIEEFEAVAACTRATEAVAAARDRGSPRPQWATRSSTNAARYAGNLWWCSSNKSGW